MGLNKTSCACRRLWFYVATVAPTSSKPVPTGNALCDTPAAASLRHIVALAAILDVFPPHVHRLLPFSKYCRPFVSRRCRPRRRLPELPLIHCEFAVVRAGHPRRFDAPVRAHSPPSLCSLRRFPVDSSPPLDLEITYV
ncbi:hypothetical protein FB45DRAFT_178961 [Roridomyces roridus]|uniref:Uncharacterized protein n=1 Tax=Roridomyces roridus TaxID=1738132 RepID=A0AAD7CDW0_9AGAR|nr:hypothetical protein FB45DRAFT_178961 [Roridomyces roridus]